ncbi:MAG: DUF1501 domain-containing protein [Acidobacteriota bacterium]
MSMTRRGFLAGCSAAIAGYSGSRFNTMAFADPGLNQEILVTVFLRGGMDGLNFLPPIDGPDRGHYEAARPTMRIPVSGPGAAINLDGQFGLHPSAAPLYPLYQDGRLAIVHGVGMVDVVNKSHFDAMRFVELGTPGSSSMTTGWLTRHLSSAGNLPSQIVMPSLAIGDLQPASLLGNLETLNMTDPDYFNIDNGPWLWRNGQRKALRNIFESDTSWLHDTGVQALDSVDIIPLNVTGGYTPSNGAVYPETSFGEHLQVLAQMIKLDLGLQVATVDLGGWDTHDEQGVGSSGYFADLLGEMAAGLAALYTDLDGAGASNYTQRLTVVVQSEFGREVNENNDNGCEHGYGNSMMVLSGNANGGLHGQFPGLHPDQLVDGTDVGVTTDYRRILSEVLIRRMCNNSLDTIFPGYTGYTPLGVVQGTDLPPGQIFSDNFETGGLSAWSQVSG